MEQEHKMQEETLGTRFIYEMSMGKYFYHGQTHDIKERTKTHTKRLKKGNHENKKMQDVYNKHKDLFKVKTVLVLIEPTQSMVDRYEQEYIDKNIKNKLYMNLAKVAGKPPSPLDKGKAVIIFKDGLAKEYPAVATAARAIGINDATLRMYLKGRNKWPDGMRGHFKGEPEVVCTNKNKEDINKKPVIINGVEYTSSKEAGLALNIKYATLSTYLRGKVKWPDDMRGYFKGEPEFICTNKNKGDINKKAVIINGVEYASSKEACLALNLHKAVLSDYLLGKTRWPKGMSGQFKE
jgi:hypothetical protein